MQVTYIGLSEYFQRCIPKAKRKGYFLSISLIARYSDAQDLYEKLEKDWASLNDLTGDKILFVFSTPKARKRGAKRSKNKVCKIPQRIKEFRLCLPT